MEKVHITNVSSKPATRKDGTAVLTKNGKQMYSVGIVTQEYGDTWINGLMPFNPDRWNGSEQELDIFDEEYQGKTYKKFKLPPRDNATAGGESRIINLLNMKVIPLLEENNRLLKGQSTINYPEDQGDNLPEMGTDDDIPFDTRDFD